MPSQQFISGGDVVAEPSALEGLLQSISRKPLELLGVLHRGVPQQERIYLKTYSMVNLGQYFILLGAKLLNETYPFTDRLFWLGTHYVDAGHWVVVYTGPGERQPFHTQTVDTKEPTLVFHWGQTQTVFNNNSIVPCLIRIDQGDIQIGPEGP